MTHTFLETTLDFNIVYKKRKTIGIYIDLYGNIEAHVPKDTMLDTITALFEKNWEEISKKSKEMKARTAGTVDKVYNHGEEFLYLGKAYPIVISSNTENQQDHIVLEEDRLHIYVKEQKDETIQIALKRFYYQQCKAMVEKRIRTYQPNFKMKPRSIRITDDKSNWGTCSSRLELTFNWRLAMAPIEVIDYVVVHEMCHMLHLNHERSFWRLVGKILPDYEKRSNWLALSSWKMTV